MRFWKRWKCHGNPLLCCQYVDLPTCNSPSETHRYGRRWNEKARKIEEASK